MDSATRLRRARVTRSLCIGLLLLLLLLHAVLGLCQWPRVHGWTGGRRRRLARGQHRHGNAAAHDPGVLRPAALARIDDEATLSKCDPGQAAWQHPDVLAVVDREGAKVDVASHHC